MFGEQAKEERFQGVMNQFVVSKLSAGVRTYFVLHTRAESSQSVLITELTKLVAEKKLDKDRMFVLATEVRTHTMFDQTLFSKWEDTKIEEWRSSKEVTLGDAAKAAKESCVLGKIETVYSDG